MYVQPALLGWRPVLLSWLNTLPSPGITPSHKAHITHLFDWLMPPMLRVVLKQVRWGWVCLALSGRRTGWRGTEVEMGTVPFFVITECVLVFVMQMAGRMK